MTNSASANNNTGSADTASPNMIIGNEGGVSTADLFDEAVQEVIDGLSKPQKTLPCKLIYDQRGSELFDQICELPEYYPTRTETKILEQYVDEIIDRIGERALLVEYGSGSSIKTQIILEHLKNPAGYVPIEISAEHLMLAAKRLEEKFPDIPIYPIAGDYTQPIEIPDEIRDTAERVVAFFPGSTIGNFTKREAEGFLQRAADLVGEDGGLIIGVDLEKDRSIVEPAYNDAQGVTAAFNLNILKVLNEQYGTNFDVDAFTHQAPWNPEAGRIEMQLVAGRDMTVTLGDHKFSFRKGEIIITEHSHKYRLEHFAELAARSGFSSDRVWIDDNRLFSVHFLSTTSNGNG